jgi:CheY-like chemotaxis protein
MKKILLINDDRREVENIEKILVTMAVEASLFIVGNGKDALNVLMGSPQDAGGYSMTKQIRPDIILLDKNLPDMTGHEFMEIMRKYYSLENIKVFLLTDFAGDDKQVLSEKFAVTGYLQRPFENNPAAIENFKQLKAELGGSQSYIIFPLGSIQTKSKTFLYALKKILKEKTAVVQMGSASAKTAACLIAASVISGAAIYSENIEPDPSFVSLKNVVTLTALPDLIPQKEKTIELKIKTVHHSAKKINHKTSSKDPTPDTLWKVTHYIQKSRIFKIRAVPDSVNQKAD